MDPGIRKEAYGTGLKLVAARAYALPLYTVPTYYIASKQLGFKPPADATYPRFYRMEWK